MAENVGFAARNMKNFGFSKLRLVCPGLMNENEWEAAEHNKNFNLELFLEKAEAVAKGGGEIIKNVQIYNSIAEASFDVTNIYALSARRREIAKEVITPETAAKEILINGEETALLFGAEASGLSNEDVTLAYKMIEIETAKIYPSINLGMSVGIICYIIHKIKNEKHFIENERGIKNLATLREVEFLTQFLEEKLEQANYFKVPKKREGMMINIKNIFTKTKLTEAETRTLIGIFNLIK